jgi:hypothetical protein
MPLSNVKEQILASVRHLTHVKGEIVSFERVRDKTFTKVPAVVSANASLISKHWNLSGGDSSAEVILYQQNVEGGGCKIRYQDDPQGCVTCFHDHKCPAGWSYHTYKHCGFLHWGCRSVCKQEYDCPTAAPTTSPTRSPTVSPTTSPTLFPTSPPTFAPFTIPQEIKRATPFVGFTGDFYLINELTGQVIEQAILAGHPRPGRFQCSDLIDDPQGCVTCFHDDKCPTGSTYIKYEHCGFLHWGCRSICSKHKDCAEPFEALFMGWIRSSKDELRRTIPKHPQLWHFNQHHNRIIASANDWVIQIRGDGVVAAPATSESAYGLSYDPESQNIRIGEDNLILCVGSDDPSKLTLCQDPDSAESRWIFKTPEEAHRGEYVEHIERRFYVASKESDLIVEQTYNQKGYPLTTWVPDGSSGQLWYSDGDGRILNVDGYIMEAVDFVAIKYIIPDTPVGENFAVSSPNHPDFQVTMTRDLWNHRGSTHYYLSNVSPENFEGLVSTSHEIDEALVGKQQWDLRGGQLVNGLRNRKLAIHDKKNDSSKTKLQRKMDYVASLTQIGVECSLEDETTDEFYLVPEAMIVSWIDLVVLKKIDVSYAREEVFYYQKVAAFHLDTIIGVSPEELLSRANIFQQLISDGVDKWRKVEKDKAVSSIAFSSVDVVGSLFTVIGTWFVPAPPLNALLIGAGIAISTSNNIIKAWHDANTKGTTEAAEKFVELLFYEIQASVVSGLNALQSFLEDYTAAVERLMEYDQSAEGQAELQAMEEQARAFAHEVGYESWKVMYREAFTTGTKIYKFIKKNPGMKAVKATHNFLYDFKNMYFLMTLKKFKFLADKGRNYLMHDALVVIKVAWIFLQFGSIVLESMKLHANDQIGAEVLKGVDAIVDRTSELYSLLNALNGDVEDLRDLDAITPTSEMFFTNDELNDKWRTLTDMGNGELDSPVYGKLNDVNWYPGCDNIPCARLD